MARKEVVILNDLEFINSIINNIILGGLIGVMLFILSSDYDKNDYSPTMFILLVLGTIGCYLTVVVRKELLLELQGVD